MPDAGNLAAFLLRLREENSGAVYQRILSTIRLIAPFFDDLDLEPAGPSKKDIMLNWRDKGSDQVFGPHQLSDGTLRAFELIDDGQHSAPSKRIIEELPDYEDAKPAVGPQVAKLIGLEVIRTKCPHFAAWLSRLEKLGEDTLMAH